MRYFSAEQILWIHSAIINETGGAHGVRDSHAILSLVDSPKQSFSGKDLYPLIFEKAAIYARDIIMNHPFVDGNKRTGITMASVFLENNGYRISAEKGEIEKFALRIVTDKLQIKKIAQWFEKNSKKI